MKLTLKNEVALKEKSIALGIPFADLMRGYMLEEALQLIYSSPYEEVLWVCNPQILGLDAYRKGGEAPLCFYYLENSKAVSEEKMVPGQKLSWKLAVAMLDEIFRKERSTNITWKGRAVQTEEGFAWNLTGCFMEMEVPLVFTFMRYENKIQIPQKCKLRLFMENAKQVEYLAYATENVLAESLYEIMSRLELIADMESYGTINRILKTMPVSGRYVMEIFGVLAQDEPKLRNEKRLEMIRSYRNYAYMRKRWEKYQRNKKQLAEPWKEVIDRLLAFAEPLWNAFCHDEIFFEDWMPELGRFLS